MPHYEAFTKQFFFANPDVRRFHTMVVMDRVKTSLSVPIEIHKPAERTGKTRQTRAKRGRK
jgi:hypothetical protein